MQTNLYFFGPWIIREAYHEETYEDPSIDDIGGNTWSDIDHRIWVINPRGKTHQYDLPTDWRILQRIFRAMSAHKYPLPWKYHPEGKQGLTGEILYKMFRPYIPYKELTARQQVNDDKRSGHYPNLASKYVDKIPVGNLVELLEELRMNHSQDCNDNTMYGESWRNKSRYMGISYRRIQELDQFIKSRLPA